MQAGRWSWIQITLMVVVGLLVAAAGFIWSGFYDVGADRPHPRVVHALLESLRERSVDRRAGRLQVPDLGDRSAMVQGAGNYDAMCKGCHLAPGMLPTELSQGLYPAPPNLAQEKVSPAEAFWIIKHGIKASGMPAWGGSMADEYIWNIAAFLQVMPDLDAAGYQTLVESSEGHAHGGGETMPDAAAAPVHVHQDGRKHVH